MVFFFSPLSEYTRTFIIKCSLSSILQRTRHKSQETMENVNKAERIIEFFLWFFLFLFFLSFCRFFLFVFCFFVLFCFFGIEVRFFWAEKKIKRKRRRRKKPTTLGVGGRGGRGGETKPQNKKKAKKKASKRLRQRELEGPTREPRRRFAKYRGVASALPGQAVSRAGGAGRSGSGCRAGEAAPARAGSG